MATLEQILAGGEEATWWIYHPPQSRMSEQTCQPRYVFPRSVFFPRGQLVEAAKEKWNTFLGIATTYRGREWAACDDYRFRAYPGDVYMTENEALERYVTECERDICTTLGYIREACTNHPALQEKLPRLLSPIALFVNDAPRNAE